MDYSGVGPASAATHSFTVRIHRKKKGVAHDPDPTKCVNPVSVICSTVMHLPIILSRKMATNKFTIAMSGSDHAGDTNKIISHYLDPDWQFEPIFQEYGRFKKAVNQNHEDN